MSKWKELSRAIPEMPSKAHQRLRWKLQKKTLTTTKTTTKQMCSRLEQLEFVHGQQM